MAIAQQNSVEDLTKEGFFLIDESPHEKVDNAITSVLDDSFHGLAKSEQMGQSVWTQSSVLFAREFKNLVRDKASIGARMGITIFLNILFGVIFYDVGRLPNTEAKNVQSHFGALLMVLLSAMFGSAQPALMLIPAERPIFLREYSTAHYSVFPYFLSRLLMEAFVTFLQILAGTICCFFLIGFQANFFHLFSIIYTLAMGSTAIAVLLGCSMSNPDMAMEFLPILFVPQMLFAGFFVAIDLIPEWLRWIQYICSLTFGVRLALTAEFGDCAKGDNPDEARFCKSVIEDTNADLDATWWYWLVLVSIFVLFRLIAIITLKSKASF